MTHCKDCRYYRSGHWLEGGQQHGGPCPMLTRMLAIANARLGWIRDDLYVPEAFGCSMGKPTRDDGAGPVEEADAETLRIITGLVRGIECWAADEDGVHDDCWESYRKAKGLLSRVAQRTINVEEL